MQRRQIGGWHCLLATLLHLLAPLVHASPRFVWGADNSVDSRGEQTSTLFPDGTTQSTVYDDEGRAIMSTDRAGRTSTTDPGRLAGGSEDSTQCCPQGETSVGARASQYDELGRAVKQIAPDGSFTTSTYDAAGRLIASTDALGNTTTHTYDDAGRRIAVTDALGQTSSYTLNAAGLQTHMTDALGNVTETQFDVLNRPVKTIYADGNFETTAYGPAGPISQWSATQGEHHFLLDAHGTVRALVDATGQVVSSMDYDSHGVPLGVTPVGAPNSSLGYNGEYFDADLGLIYLRARWYNPTVGRFHTRDPYQGMFEDPMSMQAYLFAHGDPESMIDPSGNFPLTETLASLRIRIQQLDTSIKKVGKVITPAIQVVVALEVLKNYEATATSILRNGPGSPASQWLKWGEMTIAMAPALKYQYEQLKTLKDESRKSGAAESIRRWGYFGQLQKALGTSMGKARSGGWNGIEKSNNLPDLTPDSSTSIFLRGGLTGSRSSDRSKAQSQAWGKSGIWHHHEVTGIMQAVDRWAHAAVQHYGGVYFWSVCNNKGYR